MSYIKSVVIGTISISIISLFAILMEILPPYVLYHFQNESTGNFLLSLFNFVLFYQDEGVFPWILWYVGGVITGLVARGAVKGTLSAFSVPIILVFLYWILLIFPFISTPTSIDIWEIVDELYYLTNIAVKFALISAIGGVLGGAATRQR